MPEAFADIRNLGVSFPGASGRKNAIDGVSLQLAAGQTLGILGESGSGKSVMLRSILRLLPARARVSGSIAVGGRDVFGMRGDELLAFRGATAAMVFQEPLLAFDPVYTVGRQIAETIVHHEGCGWAQALQRARELFDRVRIPSAGERLKSYPHEMSGGMLQRAMIALALSCRPKLLLADEPTTALDATVQIQILLLLRELQADLQMSMIFVTHDIGAAVEVADHIGVMQSGRLLEHGPVERVIDHPEHPYTQSLLRAAHGRGTKRTTIESAQ